MSLVNTVRTETGLAPWVSNEAIGRTSKETGFCSRKRHRFFHISSGTYLVSYTVSSTDETEGWGGGLYKLPGPGCVAYVFVSLGSIRRN
jgi:hypothetical protein